MRIPPVVVDSALATVRQRPEAVVAICFACPDTWVEVDTSIDAVPRGAEVVALARHTDRVLFLDAQLTAHAFSVNRLSSAPALRAMARRCFPKEQHASRGAAEAQLRSLQTRDLAKNDTAHTYECPHCGTWHVGHTVKS